MSIGDLHHRVGGLTLAMISGWSDEEGEAPIQPSTGQSITGGYQANVAQRAAKLVNSVGTQTDRDVVMDAAVAAHPVTGEPARGADPEDREVDMRDMLTELRVHIRTVEIRATKWQWTTWGSGIIDYNRHRVKFPKKEGLVISQAVTDVLAIVLKVRCEFKIGIARNAFTRWQYYGREEWVPTHMFVVSAASSRPAALMLEAAVIAIVGMNPRVDTARFLNEVRNDMGGGGVNWESTRYEPHYLYVVTRA